MAFYDEKDQEQLDQQGGQPVGRESAVIGAQGASGSGAGGSGQPAAAGGGSSAASPFVGINQYIDANKQQSQKLAESVGGYVEQQGQAARDTLGQNQQAFNQEVDRNTVNLNQDIFNTAAGVTGQTGAEDLNEQQRAEFKRMRDALYTGPSSIQETPFWSPVNQAFQKAQTVTQQSIDPNGQRGLLGQFQQDTRGRINRGAVAFDSSLLQGDQRARDILAERAARNADLSSLLNKAQEESVAKTSKAKETTAATRQAIKERFAGDTSVQKDLEKALMDKAETMKGEAKTRAEGAASAIRDNKELTDDQLKILDMTRDQYNSLVGLRGQFQNLANTDAYGQARGDAAAFNDLSRYGTIVDPSTRISAQNVANPEEYARYAALNELMGFNNSFLSDPSIAGTANTDLLDFNRGGAEGDINTGITSQNVRIQQGAAQKEADDAAARANAERQKETDYTASGAAIGYQIAGPPGAVVGSVIGNIVCFAKNTPILMDDGTYKPVQDLKLGDKTYLGGIVQARGEAFCTQIVEYKGIWTSPNHAIFTNNKWQRAKDIPQVKIYDLMVPAMVYPIVNENHILISNNGTVYADLVEHADSAGMSDSEKMIILNSAQYIEKTKKIEETIQWTLLNSIPVLTMRA